MNDPLKQSLQVATRLEDGAILRTEADYAAVNDAAAEAPAPAVQPAAEQPTPTSIDTTSTPAESGTGEEIE